MIDYLRNKRIVLGVTGSIAAYKSADLIRRLKEYGADVRVVMTKNAKEFITPLTLQAVSSHLVHDDLFDVKAEAAMGHIELARWADLILIAPASANFISRLAKGSADDLLTTICLASKAKIAIAPAMNQGMWNHNETKINVQALEQKYSILGTGVGSQACGEFGEGRMLEPAEIIAKLKTFFVNELLSGKKVLITAGPTHEAIDPVRYIANKSSGKMGFALAEAAFAAGALVKVVAGPNHLSKHNRIHYIDVVTAEEMLASVMQEIDSCDIFIAAAAVADYRPKQIFPHKIHKEQMAATIELIKNPDIVQTVGALPKKPFIVGFAAETHDLLLSANSKLQNKNMDMIIANDVSNGQGMNQDENRVWVLSAAETLHEFPKMRKDQLAEQLIPLIAKHYRDKTSYGH